MLVTTSRSDSACSRPFSVSGASRNSSRVYTPLPSAAAATLWVASQCLMKWTSLADRTANALYGVTGSGDAPSSASTVSTSGFGGTASVTGGAASEPATAPPAPAVLLGDATSGGGAAAANGPAELMVARRVPRAPVGAENETISMERLARTRTEAAPTNRKTRQHDRCGRHAVGTQGSWGELASASRTGLAAMRRVKSQLEAGHTCWECYGCAHVVSDR